MGEKSHESDRLVIAGQPVPDELAPRDSTAGGSIPGLLRAFLPLNADGRAEVRALVRSLPQRERTDPVGIPHAYDAEGPGPLVMRLLRNRNMNLGAVAKSVYMVTRGRRYWAVSTYGMIGHGGKELTPDLLGDLCALLDVPAADLARLTGITPDPAPVNVGDLVWDVRRLTRDQIEHVIKAAEAIRPR
ncbi:hypothetical protein SAMN04488564_111116 [Lentzea waywayandensis]|uniref:Uncharacterized protein n=1 Tax=Lentzea waywayandensis TaxID=84724 RepID=A0A1I6FC65_9PSEU|nr:hypothetical protein [Lentzea waywayandensis]SFR27576.1 hypothetical protein SAMN04488564_111116 [Lentzea waywayandensis]